MSKLKSLTLHTRSLCPTDAEIWVLPAVTTSTPATEIRGQLVGPTSPFATTVEVAYPLQPFPKLPEGLPLLARRIVIPEPSLWSPEQPFLYRGAVEVWENGSCLERRLIRHGLRSARLGIDGLIWNGQRLLLTAWDRPELTESELRDLRRGGVNALLLDPNAGTIWEAAERFGFVVIGKLGATLPADSEHSQSVACLGWLTPAKWLGRNDVIEWIKITHRVHRRYVGVELDSVREIELPDEISFVAGPSELPTTLNRPRLLRGGAGELGRINS